MDRHTTINYWKDELEFGRVIGPIWSSTVYLLGN